MRLSFMLLICALLSHQAVLSQDIPMVTGEEANPLMMLDDITSSLLADDQVFSGGAGVTDVTSSLLEDLNGVGAGAGSGTGAGGDQLSTETEPPPPSTVDPAVPVDGGLSLLLAAGAAYGARRVRGRKEKK